MDLPQLPSYEYRMFMCLLKDELQGPVYGQLGGYVVVKSNLSIHKIEIFGTENHSAMADVPTHKVI